MNLGPMFSKSHRISVRTFAIHFWFPATLPDFKKTKKRGNSQITAGFSSGKQPKCLMVKVPSQDNKAQRNKNKKNCAVLTFPASCPACAMRTIMLSTMAAFSGLATLMLATENHRNRMQGSKIIKDDKPN